MSAPMILFYNLKNKKGSQLRMICLRLNIRVRDVAPEDYAEPVAALAGLAPRTGAVCEGELGDEMLVMVNLGNVMLNRFLQELRAAHVPPIALKAILTPTNAQWSSLQLRDELQQEREAILRGQAAHSEEK